MRTWWINPLANIIQSYEPTEYQKALAVEWVKVQEVAGE
jgi:hypothetical protein